MRSVIRVPADDVTPPLATILRTQGLTDETSADERTGELARQAQAVFSVLGRPSGVVMDVLPEVFETVYRGEGRNADAGPVDALFPRASRLALYAVTIGEPICQEISRLFEARDFALAAMLDGAASEGTERLAAVAEAIYAQRLRAEKGVPRDTALLRFSPGYCGWDLTGQKALFAELAPGDAGIHLLESCLMRPLKSISGVIIAGPRPIFDFDCDYVFCQECETFSCRDRLAALDGI